MGLTRSLYFVLFVTQSLAIPIEEKIVNGTDAKLGEIPYIVSLRYNKSHTCGGSIIDNKHILTAAHCVYGRNKPGVFSIQYGVTHISKDDTNSIPIESILIHPDYTGEFPFPNDVAILKLVEPIQQFSDEVKAIDLPESRGKTPSGQEALLAGWGLPHSGGRETPDLKKVHINVYSDGECMEAHRNKTNSEHHLCAGVTEGGKGQCNGDSGGPLTIDSRQIGIVSWSVKPCTLKGYPGVFTKVANYVDWINEHLN